VHTKPGEAIIQLLSNQGDVVQSVLIFDRRHASLVFWSAVDAGQAGAFLAWRVSSNAKALRLLPPCSPAVRDFQLFVQTFGRLGERVAIRRLKYVGAHSKIRPFSDTLRPRLLAVQYRYLWS
jgi:hypothetical protein